MLNALRYNQLNHLPLLPAIVVNTSPQHPTPTDSTSDIPPLESGDRLIRLNI
ncbi:hypothetical protein [Nostoc sp.]|uniref:hypothetical protein n=1 Tax=Nostoc sp. TaxID=1180 RepID=UPI002FFB2EB4